MNLSDQASDFPKKLSTGEKVSPLQSPFTEISNLIENFNTMSAELRNRFGEIQDSAKKLRRANHLKDEFLATLSHELRTPLNIIVGHTELLKNPSNSKEDMDFSIDAIERASKAQTQLVSDLLDVSAITTGKIQLKPQFISLSDLVLTLVENFKFSANSKGISLSPNIMDSPCMFYGDETRLQQIFWNLISNSIKFTPKGGFVAVELANEGDAYVVRVRDSGKGIDKEFLPHVFERFRQEDASSTRKYGGLGLGLSIVYHLVDLHGGTIQVFSDGVDTGSTFEIRFPRQS